MSRWRRILVDLLACVGSVLVCVLLLEAGVRRFDPQPVVRYCYSPESFYAPQPGARFVYRRREFAVPIEYNRFGMRDRDRVLEKAVGMRRVALVGDSQVEAKEVVFDSTLAARLERELRRRGHGEVEVLNFGVSGFGTVATAARFRAVGAGFSPDLVVYLYSDNDPGDNVGRDRQLWVRQDGVFALQRLPDDAWTRLVRGGLDTIKRRSEAYLWCKFRIAEARSRTHARAPVAEAGASDPAWEATRDALWLLHGDVRAAGARLIVAQAGGSDADAERLRQSCGAAGIGFHDLRPALARAAEPIRYVYDGHWRAAGHRIACAELVDVLGTALEAASVSGMDSRSGR